MHSPQETTVAYSAYVGQHELAERYLWGRLEWLGGAAGAAPGTSEESAKAKEYLDETWRFFDSVTLCGESGSLDYIATMHPDVDDVAHDLASTFGEARAAYERIQTAVTRGSAAERERVLADEVPVLVSAMQGYLNLEAKLYNRLSGAQGQRDAAAERPRILIVEDEEDVRAAIEFALERHGFHCLTAATGPEALVKADEFHPSLVLLDLNIPGLDGLEVCLRLKASEEHGATAVFIVSARCSSRDVFLGSQVGADGFIAKPFSITDLVDKVREQLHTTAAASP